MLGHVRGQPISPPRARQLDHKRRTDHLSSCTGGELGERIDGAARRQEVVMEHHPRAPQRRERRDLELGLPYSRS